MKGEGHVPCLTLSLTHSLTLHSLSQSPLSISNTRSLSTLPLSPSLSQQALDSALDFLQDADTSEEEEEDDEFDMFEIYEDAPDLDTPYDLIADLEKREADSAAAKVPSAMLGHQAKINLAIAKWRLHDKDVGSAEVQVAIANERILYLTQHLLANRKDVAAKRGLQALVVMRRKFLSNIYAKDGKKALSMAAEMKIRFRPTGLPWDKESKYAAYKNTKTVFKKAKK
jgi:small subunit ribosomal protein S15